MICTDCKKSFELIAVGDIECPNCKAQLHVQIGGFSTNVAEYKKYIYQNNIFFAFAILSSPFTYFLCGKNVATGIGLLLIIFPNIVSAFKAGFIVSRFGPLLRASKPKTFRLVMSILILLFVFILLWVIGSLI